MTAIFDEIVIGAGMAGLTTAALLARSGRKVLVLEAHDTPGGYAHTFIKGKYRFCAQVHYIFGCAPGGSVHEVFRRLDLLDEVTFEHLDRDGYDHVVVGRERVAIPTGLDRYRDQLIARYPEAAAPLTKYFEIMVGLDAEITALPEKLGVAELLRAPFRYPLSLRYRTATLQDLYDKVGMPPLLQAILAGQCGDYLLPPNQVSLPLHVALVANYDRGAYYPTKHYCHMVETLAQSIRDSPGCELRLNTEVDRITVSQGAFDAVRTVGGETFQARRCISNVDPATTLKLIDAPVPRRDRERGQYPYSTSTFTLYLGIEGIDLRDHGFGSYNVWHYPHADINEIYRRQVEDHDLSEPWLFLSTPTLHSPEPGLAPPGHQILEVATSCDYEQFAALRRRSHRDYSKAKTKLRDHLLDVISEHYIPGLRDHLAMKLAGTPLTNERFCRAPRGNAYGSNLDAGAIFPRFPNDTAFENLHVVNATAGYPSVGGTMGAGIRLVDRLLQA